MTKLSDAWTARSVARILLMVSAAGLACADSAAAPIDCKAAAHDVEKTICAHPDLLGLDKAISDALDAIKDACPSQRGLLVQEQKFWLRERWDCRNVEGVLATPDGLASCLTQRMEERLRRLADAGLSCASDRLRGGYRFVDPDYLRRYSAYYLGKRVSVHGSLHLESCDKPDAVPTAAVVVGSPPQRDRFPATFSAMPDEEREFLCAQQPAAHWTGIVREGKNGAYLFMDAVLGRKLPASGGTQPDTGL